MGEIIKTIFFIFLAFVALGEETTDKAEVISKSFVFEASSLGGARYGPSELRYYAMSENQNILIRGINNHYKQIKLDKGLTKQLKSMVADTHINFVIFGSKECQSTSLMRVGQDTMKACDKKAKQYLASFIDGIDKVIKEGI